MTQISSCTETFPVYNSRLTETQVKFTVSNFLSFSGAETIFYDPRDSNTRIYLNIASENIQKKDLFSIRIHHTLSARLTFIGCNSFFIADIVEVDLPLHENELLKMKGFLYYVLNVLRESE